MKYADRSRDADLPFIFIALRFFPYISAAWPGATPLYIHTCSLRSSEESLNNLTHGWLSLQAFYVTCSRRLQSEQPGNRSHDL